MNIRERDDESLISWKVYTCYSSHGGSPLSPVAVYGEGFHKSLEERHDVE